LSVAWNSWFACEALLCVAKTVPAVLPCGRIR
jgi:hypothetical protein